MQGTRQTEATKWTKDMKCPNNVRRHLISENTHSVVIND